MCIDFVHLAGHTPFDVVCDEVFHVWPPVVGLN